MSEKLRQNQEDPQGITQEELDILKEIGIRINECESTIELEEIQSGLGLTDNALKEYRGHGDEDEYERIIGDLKRKKIKILGKRGKLVEQADEQWSSR